ncbi:MAG TPA: hypothetical protein VJJ78_01605 [Candidatus Saccharimonadales bacterium]|nr:hypothetical protein [Candidatus Saccharimonadales bacterium]
MSKTDEQQPSNSGMPADNNLPPPAAGGQPTNPPLVPGNSTTNFQQPAQQGNISDTPPIADDADLIEKEWVDKAKQILEQNKDNPHALNQAINRVKADYIKKRYNKDLKTSND